MIKAKIKSLPDHLSVSLNGFTAADQGEAIDNQPAHAHMAMTGNL